MKASVNSIKLTTLSSVILSVGLVMSTGAFAGGSTTLTVNARISGVCQVTTAPGILDFGTIDPSAASNATATTTFVMKCSAGVVASTAATDNGGLWFSGTKRMQHTIAGNFLPYAIAYVNDTGFAGAGFGPAAASRIVTINGTITPAQFTAALATTGAEIYADTVTITVNP